ncbi:Palmitoyl-protein hydrolase protein [Dioscorea alata]|uniref:Palmitoyl-protein hydrolase protein n=1 Tax=Dioscorea alata TaxID=55571 RepID=A0ACB7ULN9_DIOAL|nr:Palmitoyl-protein hydrolase protein [Dioscorea alata]
MNFVQWNEEESPKNENVVLKAVEIVHAMIDKEVAAGINPENVFVCGFSQGGEASLLLSF